MIGSTFHFPSGHITVFILSLMVLALTCSANAFENLSGKPPNRQTDTADTLRPGRADTPPVIDGELSEPFWKQAHWYSEFKTFIPDFDIIPEEQTEVALAYDSENLYFAFRCYDDISKIKTSLAAHDKMMSDDFVCINLDSFNDQQGLNAFYVNPQGIQGDSRFVAGNEDFSPDLVWYSAGKIDSIGYTVEVRIPLKSLRYRNDEPTVMGVILERYISRRSEHSSVPSLDPAKGYTFQTQMQPIVFYGIEHYRLLEILPAVTATRQDARSETNLERIKQEGEFSLTAKYGLTSDLILDGTVNPDFSQVESDAGQVDVNLRYSLFYPEKRPFFLEGQDNFNLPLTNPPLDPQIFYSRTIADPVFGAKLTGKLGPENTLAVLYAVDNVLEPDRGVLGRYVHTPIVRFKRSLADDSYIGFLYAGRELEHTNNRVVGFDEMIRVTDASMFSGTGFLSTARDDQSMPAKTGHTIGLRYKSETRDLSYSFSFREVSSDFRADMGYMTRAGLVDIGGYLSPRIYPETDFIQQIGFVFFSEHTKDRPSSMWETTNKATMNFYFGGNWLFRIQGSYATEIYDAQRYQTSGIYSQLRTQVTKELFFDVVHRYNRAIYYSTPEQGRRNVVTTSMTTQPSENLRADINFTYENFFRDSDEGVAYDGTITRLRFTYQVNQYLFFRTIGEYNTFRDNVVTDLLASFTYIPGTVVYLGYGSIFEKVGWDGSQYVPADRLLEMRRGLFLKMSYLWRS